MSAGTKPSAEFQSRNRKLELKGISTGDGQLKKTARHGWKTGPKQLLLAWEAGCGSAYANSRSSTGEKGKSTICIYSESPNVAMIP